jgi:hypothetical protein
MTSAEYRLARAFAALEQVYGVPRKPLPPGKYSAAEIVAAYEARHLGRRAA